MLIGISKPPKEPTKEQVDRQKAENVVKVFYL